MNVIDFADPQYAGEFNAEITGNAFFMGWNGRQAAKILKVEDT